MHTVADLLAHYPRRYAYRGQLTPIESLQEGEQVTIVAQVKSATDRRMRQRKGNILEVVITDGYGDLKLTFFNQSWRQNELKVGRQGIFSGKVGRYQRGLQFAHPDYELFDDVDTARMTAEAKANEPIPIYADSAALASWRIANFIGMILDGRGVV
jgi:ATP-dependent DNA helicase RecG